MAWKVGGGNYENIQNTPFATYSYEDGENSSSTIYSPAKIGLMYVSNYGFASSPKIWSYDIYSTLSNN